MRAAQPPNACHTPRRRGIQYAAAYRFYHCCLWNTGSPAFFAGDDVWICFRDLAAQFARGLHLLCPPRNRGRREDRVLAAPAVSRAICANKSAHEHTGQREHSGLPCAMALRLTSCSSRRTALLPPSPALLIARLTPAPRRPNHTTSPYAQATHVSRSSRVHRISPHVRDDGQRPSSAVRQAELCR